MATKTLEELRLDISLLMQKLSDSEPFLNELGQRLVESFKYGFRESKGPNNDAWKTLTHRDGKPLIDTGRLRRSIGFKLSNDNKSLSVGTNVIYARIHNEGLDQDVQVKPHSRRITMAFGKLLESPKSVDVKAHTRHVKMPQREFLGFGLRQRHPMGKALNFWANKAVREFSS